MGYKGSIGFFLQKRLTPISLWLMCLLLVPFSLAANSDSSFSRVRENCDIRNHADGYHCLGYIVEQGYNKQLFAKEQIEFEPTGGGDHFVIKLNSPLVFRGDLDGDCSADHPLCNDGIAFTMHGHNASKTIILDTTNIQNDQCAIRIKAPSEELWMVFTDFRVRSKQINLVEEVSTDGNADAAICTEGGDKIIIQDVELETDSSEGAVCGNGKVEEGEDCDEGHPDITGCETIDGEEVCCGNGKCNGYPGAGCNINCGTAHDNDNDDVNSCFQGPDYDGDGLADDKPECDPDLDGDGVPEAVDNCSSRKINPATNNTYFEDIHNDNSLSDEEKKAQLLSFGNPTVSNPETGQNTQPDMDGDGHGDHCDDDIDEDGYFNNGDGNQFPNANPQDGEDNCPFISNPDQNDWNLDGEGDVCDDESEPTDEDQDGVEDNEDNCPDIPNPPDESGEQPDMDNDGEGDACDDDTDGDGLPNADEEADELCLDPTVSDSDMDGLPDGPGQDGLGEADPCPCVPDPTCTDPNVDDVDHDGVSNDFDNCPNLENSGQEDEDGDGVGDACDPDTEDGDADEDGIININDNCPTVSNEDQADVDGDNIGDVCDPNPNVADGTEVDPEIEESTGSGCFNSLSPHGNPDAFSWLILLSLAGLLQVIRKFVSPY